MRVTTWGTPSVAHPAAKAEATPVGESSIATQSCGVDTESVQQRHDRAPDRALPFVTSSPVIEAANDPAGAAADDGVGQPPPRHGDEGARHTCGGTLRQQARRTRAPRQFAGRSRDHTVEQTLDDRVRFEPHATPVAQDDRGVEQVEPDDRVGVGRCPRAVELGDEFVFALDPVRLGVDERAVHVPQDRRRLSSRSR